MKTTILLTTVTLMASLGFAADSMPSLKEDNVSRASGKSAKLKADESNERSAMKSPALSLQSKSEVSLSLKKGSARNQNEGSTETSFDLKQLKGGGQVGNGGGGIKRNGNYMTFYTAGIRINPRPKQIHEIPTMSKLLDFFASNQVLTSRIAGTLLTLSTPSAAHQYFDVDRNHFSKEDELRLRKVYAKLAKIPVEAVSLFAITDPETKDTYLLPNFYDLKTDAEKMAILAHENMWLYCPDCKYKDIVKWEQLFQAHFENPDDRQHAFSLAASFSGQSSMRYAVAADVEDGILSKDGTLQSGRDSMSLTVTNLFGAPFVNCIFNSRYIYDCSPYAMLRLSQLQRAYPDSLLIRWLAEANASHKLGIVLWWARHCGDQPTSRPNGWEIIKQENFVVKGLPTMAFKFNDEVMAGDRPEIVSQEVCEFETAGESLRIALVGSN